MGWMKSEKAEWARAMGSWWRKELLLGLIMIPKYFPLQKNEESLLLKNKSLRKNMSKGAEHSKCRVAFSFGPFDDLCWKWPNPICFFSDPKTAGASADVLRRWLQPRLATCRSARQSRCNKKKAPDMQLSSLRSPTCNGLQQAGLCRGIRGFQNPRDPSSVRRREAAAGEEATAGSLAPTTPMDGRFSQRFYSFNDCLGNKIFVRSCSVY